MEQSLRLTGGLSGRVPKVPKKPTEVRSSPRSLGGLFYALGTGCISLGRMRVVNRTPNHGGSTSGR